MMWLNSSRLDKSNRENKRASKNCPRQTRVHEKIMLNTRRALTPVAAKTMPTKEKSLKSTKHMRQNSHVNFDECPEPDRHFTKNNQPKFKVPLRSRRRIDGLGRTNGGRKAPALKSSADRISASACCDVRRRIDRR